MLRGQVLLLLLHELLQLGGVAARGRQLRLQQLLHLLQSRREESCQGRGRGRGRRRPAAGVGLGVPGRGGGAPEVGLAEAALGGRVPAAAEELARRVDLEALETDAYL